MDILKKISLFVIATMAAVFMIAGSLNSFGFHSPISALVVNWFVLSWIATVTLVTHLSFPAVYYKARSFERTGQLYERIGIRLIKRLLRRWPLRILSPTLRFPKARTVSALRNLENEMQKAETAHTLTFIFMLWLIGNAAVNGWLDSAMWMLLFAMLINVYPIMVQRYNRIKLQEIIHKQAKRQLEWAEKIGIQTNADHDIRGAVFSGN